MSRVYWDTMLFAYLLEGSVEFGDRVADIYTRMLGRGDRLCTSSLAMGELLVGPMKVGADDHVKVIREFMHSSEVELISFGPESAVRFAQIRSSTGVLPADAIHLACASSSGTDLFLTNDRALLGLAVPGIQFIAGLDVNVL